MIQKTLGGDRLGSGKKQKIELHGYERSTHDLSYVWRSTMAAGTLVPFLRELALPGDTFDIDLDADIKTHPTLGPLFGSYKVQLDVFMCPIRLYQGKLHNNMLGIGLNMENIKLPVLSMDAVKIEDPEDLPEDFDLDNAAVNPSCLLAYLGYRGPGVIYGEVSDIPARTFNAVPYLAYWDIYKQYYSNKQEEIGACLHNAIPDQNKVVDEGPDDVQMQTLSYPAVDIPYAGLGIQAEFEIATNGTKFMFECSTPNLDPSQIILITSIGEISLEEMTSGGHYEGSSPILWVTYPRKRIYAGVIVYSWRYITPIELYASVPKVQTFPLENIDIMRERILAHSTQNTPFNVNAQALAPYSYALGVNGTGQRYSTVTQEGLALKTYQSDLFNNWLQAAWVDEIATKSAVDIGFGYFTMDQLNLAKKVYDLLNRVTASGGTYQDWLDATYTHKRIIAVESPVYHGGLIKELVFQEVISNAAAEGDTLEQPLGTLAGRGVMSRKHKGGKVVIKVDEPSYIIGIISLTPRIDYSQGNKWDIQLATMDDLHKPALDQIGFQDLITEQMAWWDTRYVTGWVTKSAGKQPAWINYMTNTNVVLGNFAIKTNEMFMVLCRNYEYNPATKGIKDLTTYIDPSKFNNIFAQTSLDAQNFWVQIGVGITARRKMSAKVIPNL